MWIFIKYPQRVILEIVMADISKIKIDRIDGLEEELQKVSSPGDLCYSLCTSKTGWLLCDGTSYSVSDYPNLFNVIGYIFGGSGDNFNVPNYKGKFLQMINDNQSLGQEIEAGLPNITGSTTNALSSTRWLYTDLEKFNNTFKGALQPYNAWSVAEGPFSQSPNRIGTGIRIDASRSSSIYGKSNTVQPPASLVNYFIKY